MNITSNNGVRIPKPHYVDSFTHPVERVQYPTVAVCPPQLEAAATGEETYDPWQIIRAVGNMLQFECDDSETCSETDALRNRV